MIKLENFEVVGWEHAIRGMRNPMNSWDRSDTHYCEEYGPGCDDCPALIDDKCSVYGLEDGIMSPIIGPNDHELMMKLAKGGSVHAKYRRMITVYVDITAPLYWWKEFDTYKVGTVANSCSTMHKITDKEFEFSDFSCEHLPSVFYDGVEEEDMIKLEYPANDFCYYSAKGVMSIVIQMLNKSRERYLETKVKPMKEESKRKELLKLYFDQIIQLLPSSYNQKRTVMLNYEVLTGIYESRKNHKLDEWREFCKWIEQLPYSEVITG